jgi:hypothetical protein
VIYSSYEVIADIADISKQGLAEEKHLGDMESIDGKGTWMD